MFEFLRHQRGDFGSGFDGSASKTALSVSPVDVSLLGTVVRLVRLLDSPEEARVLLPFMTREIISRLLVGPKDIGCACRSSTLLAQ